jgi:hypothetical protein
MTDDVIGLKRFGKLKMTVNGCEDKSKIYSLLKIYIERLCFYIFGYFLLNLSFKNKLEIVNYSICLVISFLFCHIREQLFCETKES